MTSQAEKEIIQRICVDAYIKYIDCKGTRVECYEYERKFRFAQSVLEMVDKMKDAHNLEFIGKTIYSEGFKNDSMREIMELDKLFKK